MSDFQGKNPKGLVEALELLKQEKVSLVYRSNLYQKFAVMDQKLVWVQFRISETLSFKFPVLFGNVFSNILDDIFAGHLAS